MKDDDQQNSLGMLVELIAGSIDVIGALFEFLAYFPML